MCRAPDTPEIPAARWPSGSNGPGPRARIRSSGSSQIVPKDEIIALYTHASLFACPSVYEPFGIINLEAMACGTPVVASAVGGIIEVVVPGKTGLLVPVELPVGGAEFEPKDPAKFARDFAEALTSVVSDPDRAAEMGRAGRRRAIESFSWDADRRADQGDLRLLDLSARVASPVVG